MFSSRVLLNLYEAAQADGQRRSSHGISYAFDGFTSMQIEESVPIGETIEEDR